MRGKGKDTNEINGTALLNTAGMGQGDFKCGQVKWVGGGRWLVTTKTIIPI